MYIDISKYNPTIDYSKLKRSGVDGAIIRVCSTNTNGLYLDDYAEKHYNGCVSNGIPVGVYFYTERKTQRYLDSELSLVKGFITGKKIELPVIIDVESNYIKSIGKSALTDLVVYALNTIQNWGYYAMYYTYKNYLQYLDTSRLAPFDFWLAYYTTTEKPNVGIPYGMHQYTSNGSVNGVSGRVDCSRVYKDYPTVIKNNGLNHLCTPDNDKNTEKPLDPSSSLTEIVHDINTVIEMLTDIKNRL